MSEPTPSHRDWYRWEVQSALWDLSERYRSAYDRHRKTWDLDWYAENAPEDLQELTDEREGLRLLWTYWRSEHDSISPRETTEDERRLMYIGGQSL